MQTRAVGRGPAGALRPAPPIAAAPRVLLRANKGARLSPLLLLAPRTAAAQRQLSRCQVAARKSAGTAVQVRARDAPSLLDDSLDARSCARQVARARRRSGAAFRDAGSCPVERGPAAACCCDAESSTTLSRLSALFTHANKTGRARRRRAVALLRAARALLRAGPGLWRAVRERARRVQGERAPLMSSRRAGRAASAALFLEAGRPSPSRRLPVRVREERARPARPPRPRL